MNGLVDRLNDMNVLNVESSMRNVPCPEEVRFGPDERDYVYAIARRIVDTAEAADDVAQDAMLLAYRHRASFRGKSRYRTWLYRIAATTALGHLRRGRRSREQLAPTEVDAHLELADPARSPESELCDAEAATVARRLLAQLDPKYRDVMMMRADHSDLETAARLGISLSNVKVRAHRARQQLRDALAREPAGGHADARRY